MLLVRLTKRHFWLHTIREEDGFFYRRAGKRIIAITWDAEEKRRRDQERWRRLRKRRFQQDHNKIPRQPFPLVDSADHNPELQLFHFFLLFFWIKNWNDSFSCFIVRCYEFSVYWFISSLFTVLKSITQQPRSSVNFNLKTLLFTTAINCVTSSDKKVLFMYWWMVFG